MTARGNMRNYLCGLDLPEVLVERFMRTDANQVDYINEWLREIYDEFIDGPCMTATMRTTVKLLGTSLTLKAGERVALTAATNIPNGEVSFFAQPLHDRADWSGSGDDSILVYYSDCSDFVEWEG